MHPLQLPITSNATAMLIVFAASLVVCHVLCVFIWPLTKQGWRIVDYAWLSLALLSVIGQAASLRQAVAADFARFAEGTAAVRYDTVRQLIAGLHGSAVCRKFERSEVSPREEEFSRIQARFDRECEYWTQAADRAPATPPQDISVLSFTDRPPREESPVRDMEDGLDRAVAEYVRARNEVEELRRASHRSSEDLAIAWVSPLLLSFAVALRMTKVTGEARIDARRR